MTREYCTKILNLPISCSEIEIKKAYRKLTLEYHPDKNPAADAQMKFIEITKAYQYLLHHSYDSQWYNDILRAQYARQAEADRIYKEKMQEILRQQKLDDEAAEVRADEIFKLIFLGAAVFVLSIYTILKIAKH